MRFRQELALAEQEVLSHPFRWATYLHGTRRYLFHRYPYALVYTLRGDTLFVVAVAHLHRKPGYWRDRLSA